MAASQARRARPGSRATRRAVRLTGRARRHAVRGVRRAGGGARVAHHRLSDRRFRSPAILRYAAPMISTSATRWCYSSGDLLILERKFSLMTGVGIRIRRIAAEGAGSRRHPLDGPVDFRSGPRQRGRRHGRDRCPRHARGDTVLTLISDDNFSMIQRTLLLQFTLRSERVAVTGVVSLATNLAYERLARSLVDEGSGASDEQVG